MENTIEIYDGNHSDIYSINDFTIPGLKVTVNGEGNKIILHKPYKLNNCTLVINGNNNILDIGQISISISQTYFCMEPRANNRIIKIGDQTYIGQAKLMCFGSNNKLIIGNDCLLSSGVHIRTGDSHAIIDHTTRELLNKNADVIIGNHCWFGVDSFVSEYTALGGVPAKIIKRNVEWLLQSDESYYLEHLNKN